MGWSRIIIISKWPKLVIYSLIAHFFSVTIWWKFGPRKLNYQNLKIVRFRRLSEMINSNVELKSTKCIFWSNSDLKMDSNNLKWYTMATFAGSKIHLTRRNMHFWNQTRTEMTSPICSKRYSCFLRQYCCFWQTG